VIAIAVVNSTGDFIGQQGFTGIAHVPGSGVYTLATSNLPTILNNTAVVITQAGLVDGSSTWLILPGQVIVRTFDQAGTLVDRIFTVVVYDMT
jgi:hypothetical protein